MSITVDGLRAVHTSTLIGLMINHRERVKLLAEHLGPEITRADDVEFINRIGLEIDRRIPVPVKACRYCPAPARRRIPVVFGRPASAGDVQVAMVSASTDTKRMHAMFVDACDSTECINAAAREMSPANRMKLVNELCREGHITYEQASALLVMPAIPNEPRPNVGGGDE